MKWSRIAIPTLREKPSDAEIPSQELLVRAGMIRTVAAGIFVFLPLGKLVLDRIENIVREEMNNAGARELILPSLQPGESWQVSGRWSEYGPEMMRISDRQGRDFCLAPTAEELITEMVAREAPSYRDLPVNLYQIQTKYRDEIRPRFGLLRAREFRMKDAYSFHCDEEDLEREYGEMYSAYSRVAERCDLTCRVVEAATGLIGGDVSHEFMVLSGMGEDLITYCSSCEYGANAELEKYEPGDRRFRGAVKGQAHEVHTPGRTAIDDVAEYLGVEVHQVLKCLLYVADGKRPVAVFIPGHREANESKVKNLLGTDDVRPLREDERELFPQMVPGFCGPVGLEGVVKIVDEEVRGARGFICGANRRDYHLAGVEEGRDFEADIWASVACALEGDICVTCGSPLRVERGIEMGHVFKLGTKYSEPMGANFIDKDGDIRPMVMGTYGIGTTRLMAAIVEQHHDEQGIEWPRSVAPADVEIITVGEEREAGLEAAESLYRELQERGLEVLWDDREVSPGIKFNDADLIGIPLQVVIGKLFHRENKYDIKLRKDGTRHQVQVDKGGEQIQALLEGLP